MLRREHTYAGTERADGHLGVPFTILIQSPPQVLLKKQIIGSILITIIKLLFPLEATIA